MKLLVTGGAGFIGSHFVRAVIANQLPGLEGASVTVLDKITYAGNFANLHAVAESNRFDFVPGDIGDTPAVTRTMRDHDAVVHFAAETSPARSLNPETAVDFPTTNVVGTQVLLAAAHRLDIPRFVQVSTAEVYGSLDDEDDEAWPEGAPLAPTTPYASTKADADLLALAHHHAHGLPVVITRASATYGAYQHPEKPIPRLLTALLAGEKATLPGDGTQIREWLHVDDHCQAVALALQSGRPGEIYHVGGSIELSHTALAALLLEECDATWARIAPTTDPFPEDHRQALNDTKIRRELGYRPHIEFTAGLTTTIRWYRQNPTWWRPLLPTP